jgi:hypothetical protein
LHLHSENTRHTAAGDASVTVAVTKMMNAESFMLMLIGFKLGRFRCERCKKEKNGNRPIKDFVDGSFQRTAEEIPVVGKRTLLKVEIERAYQSKFIPIHLP